MKLYNQIIQDMHSSLKGDVALRDVLKVIVQLQGKSESFFLKVLDSYLPSEASPSEIEAWIKDNIDWSAYKNKMQAMGTIVKHFEGRTDGKVVREVLLNF